jgi:quercetin dioxygenase-like cupin family protein
MKWILAGLLMAAALIALGGASYSQMGEMDNGDEMPGHLMLTPEQFEWKDGPVSLPKGARSAVLYGDPSKRGPFAMRIKVPANYKIMPHTHPALESVTVLEGALQMGLGDTWDDDKLTNLPAGSYAVMEVGTRHFAGSRDGATIQLHGIGPWDIHYLNPEHDPRRQKQD